MGEDGEGGKEGEEGGGRGKTRERGGMRPCQGNGRRTGREDVRKGAMLSVDPAMWTRALSKHL